MKRIRFMHDDCGEVIESDLIIVDRSRWASMPESKSGDWSTRTLGRHLLALRLDLPPRGDVLRSDSLRMPDTSDTRF